MKPTVTEYLLMCSDLFLVLVGGAEGGAEGGSRLLTTVMNVT